MPIWEVVVRHKNGVKETKTIACGCETGVKAKILSDHERSKNNGKYVGSGTPSVTDINIVSMKKL